MVSSPPGAACPGSEDGEGEDCSEDEVVRGPCEDLLAYFALSENA